jgi:fructose-1,6-bisphosphatase/inositol monophosphatase family enzyme
VTDLDHVLDQVADAMADASAIAIEPRFAALSEGDVFAKAAGELVTIADLEAERLLTDRLAELLPGVPVVGEESCSTDPTQLTLLATHRCWVVDPIDGTANFVAGSPDWAVMVALVEPTATLASWILQPAHGRSYRAELGAGATADGAPLVRAPTEPDRPRRGVIMTKFLDAATRAHVEAASAEGCELTAGSGAAGIEYPSIVRGDQDFIAFWRTRPWDHAPGTLLVTEAGGHVAQHDGTPYHASRQQPGLIAASDPGSWQTARDLLGPTPSGTAPS